MSKLNLIEEVERRVEAESALIDIYLSIMDAKNGIKRTNIKRDNDFFGVIMDEIRKNIDVISNKEIWK